MAADEEKEEFMNVVNGAITPVDFRKFRQVLGAAEYVAVEVLVSYGLRYALKIDKRSVAELAAIHAVSIPLIGGMSASFDEEPLLGYEAPMSDTAGYAAKGIPAVFTAQYIVNTALQGLHAPKISAKDVMITAASKILSGPLMAFLYPMLGESFRTNLDTLTETFKLQRAQSSLLDKDKK